jgi:NifU-like protein involved in Fe-S cluster formation
MSENPYNLAVRDCFANPIHVGDVAGGATAYFDDQGMRIRLSAEIIDGSIVELRFRAWACPHVIAAAELFCRQFEGRDAQDLEQFASGPIMRDLAVPAEKTGRILVLEDTVRSLRAAINDRLATKQD